MDYLYDMLTYYLRALRSSSQERVKMQRKESSQSAAAMMII